MTRSAAARLLEALRIRHPREIDIELIAADRNVYVTYRPLAHEEGHLLRTGKTGLIVVNETAQRSEKWRFVIAHELGHFIQHPEVDQFKLCTDAHLREWYRTSGNEVEANEFAAELLMPAHLFKPRCDRNRPSLHDVRELADEFQTSLTATALRFVAFSDEPCAVVHSTNGVIDWVKRTRDFSLSPQRGHQLTSATYAGDIFAGKSVPDRPQITDGAGWTNERVREDLDIQEHSIKLGGYASVLTFLWHPYED
jgi:Zn-dependent peptidase ImmA (M78 family)